MTSEETIVIRDYRAEDLPAIKAIHDATQIDYNFPDINAPLFLVKKVVERDGKVVMAGGMYIQAEAYLWNDPTEWAPPKEKLEAIEALDREVMKATWLQGVNQCVLWLPPGMDAFGKRLTKNLGFTQDRQGWISYSKCTGDNNE